MRSTLRLLIIFVIVSIAGLAYWRHGDRWFAPAPKAPEIRLSEETKRCLVTHVADDGQTPSQYRFMAHAVLNLADEIGVSVCRIHREKRALSAPSQEWKKFPRLTEFADFFERAPVVGDRANYARAEIEVERVLKERRADRAKQPCLAFITRFIRPAKWGTVQKQELMDAELTLLYDDGAGARFYGPKGTTQKC
jgi:hypothetical protein